MIQVASTCPIAEQDRKTTGSAQWLLEPGKDGHPRVFHRNNLQVFICGQESFEQIAKDIRSAEESIDIVCWGFDPAMELTRKVGSWPRGDTWGGLLERAALGQLNGKQKRVEVRLLVWWDAGAAALMAATGAASNMPGYAPFFVGAALDWAPSMTAAHAITLLPGATAKERREQFNRDWYRRVAAGKIGGIQLRTRSGVNAEVLASLEAEAKDHGRSALGGLGGIERLSLEHLATHHQKTIVIDYEGENPRAYVMGLNSVTDYWDTRGHLFNDPRRGDLFEGDASDHSAGKGWDAPSPDKTSLKPYQDYACRIEGEAVAAVCKNFTEAWDRERPELGARGSLHLRTFDLKDPPQRLTAKLKSPIQNTQILRTSPGTGGGERSIEGLYRQATRFARHYIYIENQYFQNTDWIRELKEQRAKHLNGLGACAKPVDRRQVPILHLMVVTPTQERPQMVPRLHDVMTELGHGSSVPNQDKMIQDELDQHARAESALAAYRARGAKVHGAQFNFADSPPVVKPLTELARSHQEAALTSGALTTLEGLEVTHRFRSLVASLWTFDPEWSLANTPVGRQQAEERRLFERQRGEWEQRQKDDRTAHLGGMGGVSDTRAPPLAPPERTKQVLQATAQRYREIYIHSKLMIVDDSMFTLGSANLNLRSFAVDSEMNVASHDPGMAGRLRQDIWALHTKGKFANLGDATQAELLKDAFRKWVDEAMTNFDRQSAGEALTSFVIKHFDKRTSKTRLG